MCYVLLCFWALLLLDVRENFKIVAGLWLKKYTTVTFKRLIALAAWQLKSCLTIHCGCDASFALQALTVDWQSWNTGGFCQSHEVNGRHRSISFSYLNCNYFWIAVRFSIATDQLMSIPTVDDVSDFTVLENTANSSPSMSAITKTSLVACDS